MLAIGSRLAVGSTRTGRSSKRSATHPTRPPLRGRGRGVARPGRYYDYDDYDDDYYYDDDGDDAGYY